MKNFPTLQTLTASALLLAVAGTYAVKTKLMVKTMPKIVKIAQVFVAAVAVSLLAGSAQAAIVTLVDESFETGLGSWATSGGTRPYYFDTTNQPPNTHNYATLGNGAVDLPGNNSLLTIPSVLALASGGFTDISISFGNQFYSGSTTRRARVEYSDDGGTNWVSLGTWDSGENGGNEIIRNVVVTLTPGSGTTRTGSWQTASAYTGAAFTDNTRFRFGFNTNNGGHHAFIDNVVISGVVVPEPATLVLLCAGATAGFAFLWGRRLKSA